MSRKKAAKKHKPKGSGGKREGAGRKAATLGGKKETHTITTYPAVWDVMENEAHTKGQTVGDWLMQRIMPPQVVVMLTSQRQSGRR